MWWVSLMDRKATITFAMGLALVATMSTACHRLSKNEQYVMDQALDLVQREDRSREPTTIEVASLNKDLDSICGYATIGERKHLPFSIKYSNALPKGGFATVDLVMNKPRFKGEVLQSEAAQSARILNSCKESGHHLPPP
jgi:hypothetical protein